MQKRVGLNHRGLKNNSLKKKLSSKKMLENILIKMFEYKAEIN